MEVEHSPIGPSSSGYWAPKGACTGFVKMAVNYPDDESMTGRSVEGTVAHGIGETMLAEPTGTDLYAFFEHLIGTLDPETGVLITAEMVEGAELYTKNVIGGLTAPADRWQIGIEQRLKMPGIHPKMFGTCDAFYVDLANKRIIVWDFKYGFGVVEAFENWQLICYVYGVATWMAANNVSAAQDWQVDMRIVQPRAYHESGPIRSWVTTLDKLQPYFEQLKTAAMETQGPKATCRPSKRCRYCPARHACKALQQSTSSASDYAETPTPELLSPEGLAVELAILTDAETAIAHRLSGLTEQAEQLIRGGQSVPGWQIKHSAGRERWTDPEMAAGMARMLGIDITKPDYLTPNQARKDAGLDEAIVAKYSERGAGKSKLAPVDVKKLKRIFNS